MALISSSLAFAVTRSEPELVVPAKPTPRGLKRLSDIDDQGGFRFQIPFIFLYKKNPSMDGQDPARVIKEGLGRALVHYYPLAGRLREGFNRKLYVDCTAEGVLFTEAIADIRLEQLGDAILSPSPFQDDVLYNVPGSDGIVGCPLLLIQVTRLRCGGFILAIRLNHVITDGFGLAEFLKTVSEMGRGAVVPSVLPVWSRDLLDAREPPQITCEHPEYEENFVLTDPTDIINFPDKSNTIQRSFLFAPDFMKRLRKQLPDHVANNCSSFELVTACFWKCRTQALKLESDEVVRVSCAVSARGKLVEKLPLGFYGNASAYPAAASTAKLLGENPLAYAVELVKAAKAKMNEEYIRSVTDFLVTKGRPSFRPRGNIVVSDTRHVGLGEVDFGWGPPAYAGPAAAPPMISAYAKYKDAEGREGIVVPVCLPISAMHRLDLELKKLVWEPKNNTFGVGSFNKIMSML